MPKEFKDRRDVTEAINWIINQLNERLNDFQRVDEYVLALQLSDYIDKLNIYGERFKDSGNLIEVEENIKSIWVDIKEAYETKYHNQRVERLIDWGQWSLSKTKHRKHGYKKGYLLDSIKRKNGSSIISIYKKVPPPIIWEMNKVVQKGYVFYSTTAKVEEIEALSSVPALPKKMTCVESGDRVLDKNLAPDEWQRLVNWVRVNSIENFINQDNNIIANPPILYLKDSHAIEITENNGRVQLKVDFDSFLHDYDDKQDAKVYSDHSTDEEGDFSNDLRPLWLIDGQHRVRGLSESIEGAELTIPIILISNKHNKETSVNPLSMVAKVFTEINTLQKSLDTLHELFLMHRFSITHPTKKERHFQVWDLSDKTTFHSRANHLSYELAAKLTSIHSSPLYSKIKILDQNSSKTTIIAADQWIKYTRNWFLSPPYSINDPKSDEALLFEEVSNFFKALINTCNHKGWKDGKDRWILTGQKKGLIQESSQFQMLLELYPLIHSLCYERHLIDFIKETNKIIPVEVFEKVLVPLKWCDWLEVNGALKIFRGGGEKGRRALQTWIRDALIGGKSFSERDVMTDTFKSIAGKGVLARPKDVKIDVEGVWVYKDEDEADGNELLLSLMSERPINAVAVASWIILDDKGDNITEKIGKIVTKCKNDVATLSLKYNNVLVGVKKLKVRVEWRNAGGVSKGGVTITKPK